MTKDSSHRSITKHRSLAILDSFGLAFEMASGRQEMCLTAQKGAQTKHAVANHLKSRRPLEKDLSDTLDMFEQGGIFDLGEKTKIDLIW